MSKKYKVFVPVFASAVFCAVSVFAYAKESPSANTAAALLEPAGQIALEYRDASGAGTTFTRKGNALPAASALTLTQAKEIAFEHAGIDGTDAVFTKEKWNKGVYELKFRNEKGKYEYEISSIDGQILDFEWDIDAAFTAAVTLAQAKEIAFEHAGIDGTDAVFTKEKLDDGVYELKFSDESGKYEYEISSIDGQILDFERDIKMPALDTAPASPQNTTDASDRILEEEARRIAQNDAGLEMENLKYITSYLLWNQHTPYAYEVKFADRSAPYTNYCYTIDLYTGDILSSSSFSK